MRFSEMHVDYGIKLSGWLLHRLFANYWLLAVCAVLLAVPFALGVLWLDREGATAFLIARDLAPCGRP